MVAVRSSSSGSDSSSSKCGSRCRSSGSGSSEVAAAAARAAAEYRRHHSPKAVPNPGDVSRTISLRPPKSNVRFGLEPDVLWVKHLYLIVPASRVHPVRCSTHAISLLACHDHQVIRQL